MKVCVDPQISYILWKLHFKTFPIIILLSSVQSLSHVRLFATPWIAARQASLSITNSQSSLRFTSIESVMPSRHLILCCPLLLLPPIPPSIRVFPMSQLFTWGGQSTGVSASASFLPKKSQGYLLQNGLVGSPCSPRDSQVFSNSTVQKHQFFGFWIHSSKASVLLKSYILKISKLKFRQLRGTIAIFKPNLTSSLYTTWEYPAFPPSITCSHNPEMDSSQSVYWYFCHCFTLPCHLLGNEN